MSTDHATPHDPTRPDDPHQAVVLTCTDCHTAYAPSTEDFAVGRTACPDRACGGWTFTSALTVPSTTGGAR